MSQVDDYSMNESMNFFTKLQQGIETLSYEFFPPKSPTGWSSLYGTLSDAEKLDLDFVSVTYGAGGSTREKTISLVGRIQNELALDTMAHLTCVGHSKDELRGILDALKGEGVKAIMALRGDAPKGAERFEAHPEGFTYGSELISLIKDEYDFTIGCACYPEGHSESTVEDQDVKFLKLKQDNGADFAVTQMFYDNEAFYRFRDKAVAAGVTIPIVAGIMPLTKASQLPLFEKMCGCNIPVGMAESVEGLSEEDVVKWGIDFAVKQCLDLRDNNIAGLHLYTLNKSHSSWIIAEQLKAAAAE